MAGEEVGVVVEEEEVVGVGAVRYSRVYAERPQLPSVPVPGPVSQTAERGGGEGCQM